MFYFACVSHGTCVYLPSNLPSESTINVGKYTVRPMDPLCFLLLTFELINWPSEKHKAESKMENLPENSEAPKILIFTGMRNHGALWIQVLSKKIL